ncbi:tetratricopeptide repeat protein [Candidatus Uhrbacteria bacterium]|nr:tetratricopeptide repeat protein [Candidatus Uhrbacteria bacterium]
MEIKSLHETVASLRIGKPAESGLSRLLGRVVDACLYLAVCLVPLWFLPATLDVLELNKQTIFVIITMVALIAWLGKSILDKRFTMTRSWIHLVVAIFLVGYLITSLFSVDRYMSMVGNFGQMQWAFTTIAAFVVFYFVLTNAVKDTAKLYHLILAFLISSTLAAVYGILQILGIFPLGWLSAVTASKNFNTVGTINSLGAFLTLPIVLSASLMVLGCKDEMCVLGRKSKGSVAAKVLVWLSMLSALAYVVLTDFWVNWAVILFGSVVLVAITMARTRSIKHPTKIIVPGVLCLISIALLIWATPIKVELPAEVSPSVSHSWNIAKMVLQDKPFFGSGPGTWIYDYSKYRAASVNTSPFWTIRFERGISSFFSLLAMVGIIGTSLWLLLVLSAVVKSALHLLKEKDDDQWQAYLTVFTGWVTVTFMAFFYNYNFSHHFAFWFLLALLASLVAKNAFTLDGKQRPAIMTVLSILFIVLSVGAISILWLAGQRLVADASYSSAVMSFRNGKPVQESIDALNSAVALNKMNDSYYRNLSQAYLINVSQELQGNPDAEKVKKVNSLIAAAIDTGKRATEIAPDNVDNWANLAIVYQAIASFTRGADEFAIKNFQEALLREPNNPVFYNEIGKLYILRSDAYRTLLNSADEKVKAEAQANVNAELDKAAEQLNQAIQVKPDFATAHYNLAIMYERQGRVKDAITKMEQVLTVNNKDIGVGFQLAILYYRDNQKEKARDLFEQIVAMQPNYSNARWYLSVLYEEAGRLDDAIAQVQAVKQLNPGNQVIDQRMEQLIDARTNKNKPAVAPLPEPLKETISGPKQLNEVQTP